MHILKVRKTGRCANGAERDGGSVIHCLIQENKSYPIWGKSLCGTEPGRRSAGWDESENEVSCLKCVKKLSKIEK